MFKRLVLESSLQWTAYLSFAVMALIFLGSIYFAFRLKKSETHFLSHLPFSDESSTQPTISLSPTQEEVSQRESASSR